MRDEYAKDLVHASEYLALATIDQYEDGPGYPQAKAGFLSVHAHMCLLLIIIT